MASFSLLLSICDNSGVSKSIGNFDLRRVDVIGNSGNMNVCSEKQSLIHKIQYEILPFLSAIFSFVKSGVSITESNFDLRRPDLLGSSENSIL